MATAFQFRCRKVQGNQVGLRFNGPYNRLEYSHDVNELRGDINTITNTAAATAGGPEEGRCCLGPGTAQIFGNGGNKYVYKFDSRGN
jgi:hypothetical protein